jgi:Domain of unknown function (DUF1707)
VSDAMACQSPEPLRRQNPQADASLAATREDALALLRRHIRDGDLTLEEYGIRVEGILLSSTSLDVVKAVEGLPSLADPATRMITPDAAVNLPLPATDRRSVTAVAPRKSVSSIFADTRLEGRWRAGEEVAVKTLFGNARIDLRQATVLSDRLVISVGNHCSPRHRGRSRSANDLW